MSPTSKLAYIHHSKDEAATDCSKEASPVVADRKVGRGYLRSCCCCCCKGGPPSKQEYEPVC